VEQEYGAFVETKYWEKLAGRTDGGVWKTTLCSSVSDFCIENNDIEKYNLDGQVIIIYTTNAKFHFFDKKSGKPTQCLNCVNNQHLLNMLEYPWIWNINGDKAISSKSSHWSNKQYGAAYPIPTNDKNYNQKKYEIWHLEVLNKGIKISTIPPNDTQYTFGEPLDLVFSPDEKSVAWHLCDPQCNLWQYDLVDKTYTQVTYPCTSEQYNNGWFITWNDNLASSIFEWHVQKREMCLKPNGKPVFPSQKQQ